LRKYIHKKLPTPTPHLPPSKGGTKGGGRWGVGDKGGEDRGIRGVRRNFFEQLLFNINKLKILRPARFSVIYDDVIEYN
jgi:hypothetical protein